jgi:hypothetical protein
VALVVGRWFSRAKMRYFGASNQGLSHGQQHQTPTNRAINTVTASTMQLTTTNDYS